MNDVLIGAEAVGYSDSFMSPHDPFVDGSCQCRQEMKAFREQPLNKHAWDYKQIFMRHDEDTKFGHKFADDILTKLNLADPHTLQHPEFGPYTVHVPVSLAAKVLHHILVRRSYRNCDDELPKKVLKLADSSEFSVKEKEKKNSNNAQGAADASISKEGTRTGSTANTNNDETTEQGNMITVRRGASMGEIFLIAKERKAQCVE
jgi:hypothetical protein